MPPKQPNLPTQPTKTTPTAPPENFYRLARRGNGWVVQELSIFSDGKFTIKDMGGWDLRDIAEKKLMNCAVFEGSK